MRTEQNSLWARSIIAIHGLTNLRDSRIAKPSLGGAWKNIVSIAKVLVNRNISPSQIVCWNETSNEWESKYTKDNVFTVSRLRYGFE